MKTNYLRFFHVKLSSEEKLILKLLLENYPNNQIATKLNIEEILLNNKILNLFEKANIKGKVSIRKYIHWVQHINNQN